MERFAIKTSIWLGDESLFEVSLLLPHSKQWDFKTNANSRELFVFKSESYDIMVIKVVSHNIVFGIEKKPKLK